MLLYYLRQFFNLEFYSILKTEIFFFLYPEKKTENLKEIYQKPLAILY